MSARYVAPCKYAPREVCQEFRVRAGIMGKKDPYYDPTQRTGFSGRVT